MNTAQHTQVWTHSCRVVLQDGHLHARTAARLVRSLRRAAPGTRFALARGDEEFVDFGEAWKVHPLMLLHKWPRADGDCELLVFACGPDAGRVLEWAEAALGGRSLPERGSGGSL